MWKLHARLFHGQCDKFRCRRKCYCLLVFLCSHPQTFGYGDSLFADMLKIVTSIHPQATWLFRATLDTTASGNWTSLLPSIQQTGLGDYCERDVQVPASWAGSKGIIGVVQDAPDGILYQVSHKPPYPMFYLLLRINSAPQSTSLQAPLLLLQYAPT